MWAILRITIQCECVAIATSRGQKALSKLTVRRAPRQVSVADVASHRKPYHSSLHRNISVICWVLSGVRTRAGYRDQLDKVREWDRLHHGGQNHGLDVSGSRVREARAIHGITWRHVSRRVHCERGNRPDVSVKAARTGPAVCRPRDARETACQQTGAVHFRVLPCLDDSERGRGPLLHIAVVRPVYAGDTGEQVARMSRANGINWAKDPPKRPQGAPALHVNRGRPALQPSRWFRPNYKRTKRWQCA
jgi:hypothetical protein